MELSKEIRIQATKIFIKTSSEEELATYIVNQDDAIKGLTENLNSWKKQYVENKK